MSEIAEVNENTGILQNEGQDIMEYSSPVLKKLKKVGKSVNIKLLAKKEMNKKKHFQKVALKTSTTGGLLLGGIGAGLGAGIGAITGGLSKMNKVDPNEKKKIMIRHMLSGTLLGAGTGAAGGIYAGKQVTKKIKSVKNYLDSPEPKSNLESYKRKGKGFVNLIK